LIVDYCYENIDQRNPDKNTGQVVAYAVDWHKVGKQNIN
jgi:hypothetical protein